MFVDKVRELEKCYLFFFLTNSLAPKLWKILTIIDLRWVSYLLVLVIVLSM